MPPAAQPTRLCPRCGARYDESATQRFCSVDGAALIVALTAADRGRAVLAEVETARKIRVPAAHLVQGGRPPGLSARLLQGGKLPDLGPDTVPFAREELETVPVHRIDDQTMPVMRADPTTQISRSSEDDVKTAHIGKGGAAQDRRARLQREFMDLQRLWLRLSEAMLASPCPDPAAIAKERLALQERLEAFEEHSGELAEILRRSR